MEKQQAINRFLMQYSLPTETLEDFDFREVKGGWIVTLKKEFKHWDKIPLGMSAFTVNEKTGKVRSYGMSMRPEGADTVKIAEEDLAKGI